MHCFEGQEIRDGRRKNIYVALFGADLDVAVAQVLGQIYRVVELAVLKELQSLVKSADESDQKKVALGMKQRTTIVAHYVEMQVI